MLILRIRMYEGEPHRMTVYTAEGREKVRLLVTTVFNGRPNEETISENSDLIEVTETPDLDTQCVTCRLIDADLSDVKLGELLGNIILDMSDCINEGDGGELVSKEIRLGTADAYFDYLLSEEEQAFITEANKENK